MHNATFAQPWIAAVHARAASEIERYYDVGEDQLKSAVRSPQSSFEATMDALSKSRRHRIYSVRTLGPGSRASNYQGNDIACGCDVHPSGEAGGGAYELDAEAMDAMNATVAYFRRIGQGIDAARWPDDAQASAATPAQVLRLRYRETLTTDRAMFDVRAAPRLRTALQAQGSGNAITRERHRLMADALRAQRERGTGTLAHLTSAARSAFQGIRSQRSISGWVDALGRKLAQPRATAEDRELGRVITAEAEQLVARALDAYLDPGGARRLARAG